MSNEEEAVRCRAIAADERAKADAEALPNAKAVLLRSAAAWEERAVSYQRIATQRAK